MNTIIETIKTPQESVNDDSVIIQTIFVTNGQKVAANDIVAQIETSKALLEIPCEKEGYIKCYCTVGQEVRIGSTLFEIFSDEIPKDEVSKIEPVTTAESEIPKQPIKNTEHKKVVEHKISNAALKLIEENNISLELFENKEFITVADVNNILFPSNTKSVSYSEPATVPIASTSAGTSRSVKLPKQKLNEINYLRTVNSSGLVSRLTVTINGNLNSIAQSQNFITSTPLPIIIHEVSRLLIKYPSLNSYFELNNQVIYESVNIGIAFDNGVNGLKVASIAACDNFNLHEIEEQITDLSLKYNDNKLSIAEISSATFTITDLFSAGVTNFHPLINQNNSAILGICGINEHSFNIELSFDHRISNGLEVSKFLNELKSRVEARLNEAAGGILKEGMQHIECFRCMRHISDDWEGSVYFIPVSNSKNSGHICSICFSGW